MRYRSFSGHKGYDRDYLFMFNDSFINTHENVCDVCLIDNFISATMS